MVKKKDFIDFIDEVSQGVNQGNTDLGKNFLDLISKKNVKANELEEFFKKAGFTINETRCGKIINFRNKMPEIHLDPRPLNY